MMFNIFQIKKVQEESKKVQEETFSFFFLGPSIFGRGWSHYERYLFLI